MNSVSPWLLLAAWSLAHAQMPVAADRVAEVAEKFNAGKFSTAPSGAALKCEFRAVPATLDFSLHFEAGYDLRFPRDQFDGPAHAMEVLLKIESASHPGAPTWLSDSSKTAGAPDGLIAGRFAIDPGSYEVSALAIDDMQRSCRSQWRLEVKQGPSLRASGAPGARTTVLLDATSLTPRASALQPADVALLTNLLSALTAQLSPEPVRLVVFNMDLESELLRLDGFRPADIDQVRSILSSVQLGTVDIHTLKGRTGQAGFLSRLIASDRSSRRVIAIGPYAYAAERVSKGVPDAAPRPLPSFFYLQYREPRQAHEPALPSLVVFPPSPGSQNEVNPVPAIRGQVRFGSAVPVDLPDTIEQMMRQVGGHTIVFATPEEFASALNHMATASAR